MPLREDILGLITQGAAIRTSEIAEHFGVSRAFAHRILHQLETEGRIALVGHTNRAHYVAATPASIASAKKEIRRFERTYATAGLAEDEVLRRIKEETGIFVDLPENVEHILDYAFTEMLNNAIEHSNSPDVRVTVVRGIDDVRFTVADHGVGIFANLREKFGLSSDLDAVNQLLKGKHTTAPEQHSGEGIYFTSRAADRLVVRSGLRSLIFENIADERDVATRSAPQLLRGTSVRFRIATGARRELTDVFRRHTTEEYSFNATEVRVRLYRDGTTYLARSQARRVTAGLERFTTVMLDFAKIPTIGQAFADEIFRVWQRRHQNIRLIAVNMNEDVQFMVERARGT